MIVIITEFILYESATNHSDQLKQKTIEDIGYYRVQGPVLLCES